MPDLDELLRERLDRPLAVVPPPLGDLQRRAAHCRHRNWALAAGAAVTVGILAAGTSLPWPSDERDVAGYASGLDDGVLDAGTGRDGPWRLLVTRDDGWCVKRVHPTGDSGACQLATPGRLDEASQFPTFDGEEYVVVVAGPAPPGTNRIVVSSQGSSPVATLVEIEGRLFYSARVPPGEGETLIVAYDQTGAVIDDVLWPPVPGPGPGPAPGLPPAPGPLDLPPPPPTEAD